MILGTSLSWGAATWVSVHALGLGFAAYNGLTAVIVNFVIATILSAVWKSRAADQTSAADFEDEAAVAKA